MQKNNTPRLPRTHDSARDLPEDSAIPEILPPTNDWIFKLIFGDERHKDNLINLLKSVIELPQEEYELIFLDTHLRPEFKNDKLGIVDVKVQTKSGKIINIEIQVAPFKDIGKRISFYKSKLIVGQIAESQDYETIQDVICICIFKKAIFPNVPKYVNRFRFMNPENGLLFEDIPEIVYTLEIDKAPSRSEGSAVWEWLQFFRSRNKEEFEMLAKRNPEIRQAANTLYTLSADEETRAEYEARLKARRDLHAQIAYAYDDGLATGEARGLEKGRAEERLETARKLKAMGLSSEQITAATGLSPEALE